MNLSLCPDCKTPAYPRYEYVEVWRCLQCHFNAIETDAKFGRLIRKLSEKRDDGAVMHLIWYPGLREWAVMIDVVNGSTHYSDDPTTALLAAGVSDE